MFYIVGKVKGDVSGYWDESYEVVKHCEDLTQSMIDEYSYSGRHKMKQIKCNRWVEIWLEGNSPYHDCIIFFNDSIDKNLSYEINVDLEKCITEYRSTIRDERIDMILN